MSFDQIVKSLCKTARTGLARFYPETSNLLPYSASIKSHDKWESSGISLRYAAMSQIGIAHWLMHHPEDKENLPELWSNISDNFKNITHIGDFALSLWAGAQSQADNCEKFAQALKERWHSQSDSCNAVELGWVVQACVIAQRQANCVKTSLRGVLDDSRGRLLSLFDLGANLFLRHHRSGLKEIISRQISCFADQVYPILALSTYGQYFEDKQCIELAAETVNQICQFQGPLGQWWWHYDTVEGKVCEEYPVFSVHQDAMAPMAIIASDRLTGQNHHREIERGLHWLFANNELTYHMLLNGDGIVHRDIEKREPMKLARSLRALLCVTGLRKLHKLAGKSFIGFRVNQECRPYHLGWILYAWADYRSGS